MRTRTNGYRTTTQKWKQLIPLHTYRDQSKMDQTFVWCEYAAIGAVFVPVAVLSIALSTRRKTNIGNESEPVVCAFRCNFEPFAVS